MNIINSIIQSLGFFISDVLLIIPQLVAAYVIWLTGNWLIDLGVKGLDKLDIKKWKVDDKVRNLLKTLLVPTGKVVLILVILDTFGIGSSIIAAVTNGITFTIAIALGLAFGRALEPEAAKLVGSLKTEIKKD